MSSTRCEPVTRPHHLGRGRGEENGSPWLGYCEADPGAARWNWCQFLAGALHPIVMRRQGFLALSPDAAAGAAGREGSIEDAAPPSRSGVMKSRSAPEAGAVTRHRQAGMAASGVRFLTSGRIQHRTTRHARRGVMCTGSARKGTPVRLPSRSLGGDHSPWDVRSSSMTRTR